MGEGGGGWNLTWQRFPLHHVGVSRLTPYVELARIDVMNAEVNSKDKRLDFRSFSQACETSSSAAFTKPRKLYLMIHLTIY